MVLILFGHRKQINLYVIISVFLIKIMELLKRKTQTNTKLLVYTSLFAVSNHSFFA